MSKITDELKPCPFCGGKAQFLSANFSPLGVLHGVECTECDAWLDCRGTNEPAAAAAWNRRAALPAIEGQGEVIPTIDDCHKMAAQVGMRFVPYTLPARESENARLREALEPVRLVLMACDEMETMLAQEAANHSAQNDERQADKCRYAANEFKDFTERMRALTAPPAIPEET